MLQKTNVKSKKQKLQKMKGHLVLGDINPRTKSNMLETFVFLDILIILLIKVLKKHSEHA